MSAAEPARAVRHRRLRLASYNIHECVGAGWPRRARPERIAAVLREIDADVVGLQEVATGPGRLDGHLYEIATLASYPVAVPGGALRDDRGDYGNALLSRWPLERLVNHPLGPWSALPREPRGALEATVRVGESPLRVVVTHLGLRVDERARQARRLLRALGLSDAGAATASADLNPKTPPDDPSLVAPSTPVVLLGDLNALTGRGPAIRRLERVFGAQAAPRSWPARLPLLRLDRILARPAGLLDGPWTHRTHAARSASDHLPLVATLRWPDPCADVSGILHGRADRGATPAPPGCAPASSVPAPSGS